MATPTLAREGARIGGLTQTQVAIACRTDSNGVNLIAEVCADPAFTGRLYTGSTGSLTAGNNYQATSYISGLSPGQRYYWRITADDGAANTVTGAGPLYSGSFRTASPKANRPWRIGYGGCINGDHVGHTVNATASQRAEHVAKNLLKFNLDAFILHGDVYYADIGSMTNGTGASDVNRSTAHATIADFNTNGAYVANAWFNQASGVDDGSVQAFRSNFITTIDGAIHRGRGRCFNHVFAAVPTYYMWDDHDRAYNTCNGVKDEVANSKATKRDNAHQVGHEAFMDLNRDLVNQEADRDFATDALGDSVTSAEYYYVDRYPVRFLVLDGRTNSDLYFNTDGAAKSMLGATQLAWVKARIDDNPMPFLAVCSPLMFDGDHGVWLTPPGDNWKSYSYEREVIFDYIYKHGDPARTVLLSADTHVGAVVEYAGMGGRPLVEVSASNMGWFSSAHLYLTGMGNDHVKRAGEVRGAFGVGGKLQLMRIRHPNFLIVEGGNTWMRVTLCETYPSAVPGWSGALAPKRVWSRLYT